MKRKLYLSLSPIGILAVLFLAISTSGCGEQEGKESAGTQEARQTSEKPKPDSKPEFEAEEASFDPSSVVLNSGQRQKAQWALVNQLFREQDPTTLSATQANIALSPASLVNTLQSLWWGTRGDTAQEIATLFNAEKIDKQEAVSDSEPETTEKSGSYGGGISLNMNSGLWFSEAFPIRDAYRDLLKDRGLARVESVDWSATDATVDSINQWCSDATDGKIETLFEEGAIRPPVAFVAASVIHFQGSWENAFDAADTQTADFTLLDGEKTSAEYLTARRKTGYVKVEEDTQLLELPFSGGHHRLITVLPGEAGPKALRKLERQLEDMMPEWLSKMDESEVDVSLPKFEVAGAADPAKALQALGVKTIFTDKADFSGASEQGGLQLDVLRHQAVVTIDEKGAEAAGATGASVVGKSFSSAVKFQADRAFLYFILGDNGEVLFAGRVASPGPSGNIAAGLE